MKVGEVTDMWTDAFHRSKMARAVFLTTKPYEGAVRAWVNEQHVPSAYVGGMYESAVLAWAVLDGGVTSTQRYGMGNGMPSGIRVVGWQTLRVLLSAIDIAPPPRPLLGEPTVPDLIALQERLRSSTPDDVQATERAGLLAQCSDRRSYQAVVRRLIGDCGLPRNRQPDDVAPGIWGDFHFSQGAAELLDQVVEPADAARIARRFKHRYDDATVEGRQANEVLDELGYNTRDAHLVRRAAQIGLDVIDGWVERGFLPIVAINSIEAGADLATAESWVRVGAPPEQVASAIKSGRTPLEVSSYVDLGIQFVLALRLAERSASIDEVRARLASGVSAYSVVWS